MRIIFNFICNNLAPIVTFVCMMITIYFARKNNVTNIKSAYFNDIYDRFLFDSIPKYWNLIEFDKELHLIGFEKFTDNLSDFRETALFFKFLDRTFYNDLIKRIDDIDDYINEQANYKCHKDKQSIVLEKINLKLEALYLYIDHYRMK